MAKLKGRGDDLFDHAWRERAGESAPLAARMRPRTLDEVVGQEHLLGPGHLLQSAVASGQLPSMVLWGPPGVGKTTLASLLAGMVGAHFIAVSAVTSGVADLRAAVEEAKRARLEANRPTVLFVDEVHRGHHFHRRHHGEPVLRGHRGAPLTLAGAHPQAADRR
ncbi:MAG: AAA family ATPase [Opitutae bacterium]